MESSTLCLGLIGLFLFSGCTANVHQVLPEVPSQVTLLASEEHKTATMSASWDIDLNSPRYDHELRLSIVAAWIQFEQDGDLRMRELIGPVSTAVVLRRSMFGVSIENATVTLEEFDPESDRGSRYRTGDPHEGSGPREEWRLFDGRIEFSASALLESGAFSLGSNTSGWISFTVVYYAGGEIEFMPYGVSGVAKQHTTFNENRYHAVYE